MLQRYFILNICLIILVALIAVSAGMSMGFTLPSSNVFLMEIIIGGVTCVVAFIYTKFRPNQNIAHTALSLLSISISMQALAMFSYVSVRLNGSKIDSQLSTFDQALGFDWVTLTHSLANYPSLTSWFSTIYSSSLSIIVLSIFSIGMFLERPERVHELATNMILGAVACSIIGGFFPADGYYVYSNISEAVLESIRPIVGLGDMQMINQIRDGKLTDLYIQGGLGVVSFPSYHTILSLVLIWAARGTGMFFAVSLIWNAAIIFSTPVMGNHYIADIIGGAVVAIAVVWATSKIYAFLRTAKFQVTAAQQSAINS